MIRWDYYIYRGFWNDCEVALCLVLVLMLVGTEEWMLLAFRVSGVFKNEIVLDSLRFWKWVFFLEVRIRICGSGGY